MMSQTLQAPSPLGAQQPHITTTPTPQTLIPDLSILSHLSHNFGRLGNAPGKVNCSAGADKTLFSPQKKNPNTLQAHHRTPQAGREPLRIIKSHRNPSGSRIQFLELGIFLFLWKREKKFLFPGVIKQIPKS